MAAVQNRGHWGTRIGFILAVSGSAVGLGNIWKFPYNVGENGGGAFVLIYLLCVLFVGLPLMIGEFAIGRGANLDPAGAFKKLSPRKSWGWIGLMAVLAAFLIMSFYSVVGGWALAYTVKSISQSVTSFTSPEQAASYFKNFAANPVLIIGYTLAFLAICGAIVIKGQKGIERSCDILMPALVIFMLILIVRVLTLPGAAEGVKFYLIPDFSKVTAGTVLTALGHAFFSLSIAVGALITYGSYLSKKENLLSAAAYVTFFDTFIAIIAGFLIFPIVFSMGQDPASGPGLVFHILPAFFSSSSFGGFFSLLFFLLLSIAAITSGISLIETVVAYYIDEWKFSRLKSVLVVVSTLFLVSIPSALSFGLWKHITLFNMTFFDHVENIADNYLLPLGGVMVALFIGYVWSPQAAQKELETGAKVFTFAPLWAFLIRYVIPVLVLTILLAKVFPLAKAIIS